MSASAIGSTDSSLVARLQARDPEAWRKFVDLYAPWLYGWSRRYGLSAADGADVTQETLLAAHRSILQFHYAAAGDSFRGWLWTIARHKIHDHRRRAAQTPAGGQQTLQQVEQLPDRTPDEATDSAESPELRGLLRRGLEQVRAEFEERTWNAFWQVVVEGRSPAEVAEALGISANAVRQAKSRVLRRLRLQLGDILSGDSPFAP